MTCAAVKRQPLYFIAKLKTLCGDPNDVSILPV